MLIIDGKIAALGPRDIVKRDAPIKTTCKDLGGATVLPGLGDAHVHFAATGFLQGAIDGGEIGSLRQLLARIAEESRRRSAGELILGLRLEHYDFPEGRSPTLQELTAAAPHNPVYLRHRTGHASFANARAFDLLNFPPGQPGVELDDHGKPTGYLIAQATQVATQTMYALNAEQVSYQSAFRAAAERAAKQGCTTVHALDDLGAVEALLQIADELPVRVFPYTQSFDLTAVEALGLSRIGGCHACALDGDFDMHTAALSEPYEGSNDDFGVLYHNDLSLQGFVLGAHERGMQLAFHAVGDRAVEQALRAFERAQLELPRPDPRHRLEHAQLISNDQIVRARDAGVILSLQPAFNHVWNHETYPVYIGARAAQIDPLKSLQQTGLHLVGGSDSTVTDLKPLLGIHAAVNHSRPAERLSVGEAVAMFSRGVAYSTFHEQQRGSIQVGMDADLTIVQDNPFAVEPTRLKDIPVMMTVVAGAVVFDAD